MDNLTSLDGVAEGPLWTGDAPYWVHDNWRQLKYALLQLGESWEVWTDWYDARLAGRPMIEELEVARAMIPAEIWQGGPKVVNAEIKQLIEIYGHKSFELPNLNELPPLPEARWGEAAWANSKGANWDFFLSYSNADEPFARWIAALLDAAGFRVFAQFNDIPAGSNFVREMQRGLEQSGRFIALQSTHYGISDHCQAEWSAAYASDPAGDARKLIQFLIRPTELPALASTIVYKSLVGLSAVDAANTVLGALGYDVGLVKIPTGWPGDSAIESIQAATGGIYNVAPGPSGLLERQPIPVSDTSASGFTPEQLFADLAREITSFREHTIKNKGNYGYSDRLKERVAKLQKTSLAGLSDCDPLALHKELVWVLRVIDLDRKDERLPPNDEIDAYESDLFGYYNRLEFIFPQLKQYRRMDARQRFTSPTPEVQQAIEAIYGSLGSPAIAGGALSPDLSKELKEAGEGISEAKKLEDSKRVSETSDVVVESHTNAATRSLTVWNWLANTREKFVKSGHKAEDVEKAIANYEKLYKAVSPQMQTYLGYLLKWFF